MEDLTPKNDPPVWKQRLALVADIIVVLVVVAVLSFVLSLIEGSMAGAATIKGYAAMPVMIGGRGGFVMKPGETKTLLATFQNVGDVAWDASGRTFVSVYTYDPKYRASVFEDASWYKSDQPARLTEAAVKPGEVGHIQFVLRAPEKIGSFKETFYLAAEDTAWISGGQFTVNIRVEGATAVTPPPSSDSTSSHSVTPSLNDSITPPGEYSAAVLLKSSKKITAKGGEAISFTVGVKNTGSKPWLARSVRTPEVSMASSSRDYKHSSWVDATTLMARSDEAVPPGAVDFLTFQFNAPKKKGTHTVKFVIAADGMVVPGGEIDIPVEVTSGAPEVKDAPKKKQRATEKNRDEVESGRLIDEPDIRVGVLIVDEETDRQVVVTCEGDFKLRDGEGKLLGELEGGDEATAFYKKNKYWFDLGDGLEQSASFLRFVPDKANDVCEVTNFDRRRTRRAANADNEFRNILELHYNSAKDRVWLINELPMEFYLRGLAETSNSSHINFQKALITAARTYALYHWERQTKHDEEFFHVDAYADQVYNGYGQEKRTPNLTRAVEETRGAVVTYDGETAITPYFSRSDGRTRAWSEVWYGDVAWLTSVSTPCDKGKTLWGHGVGMSASQALCMANNGDDWDDIVEYFYKGVELKKRWE